MTITALTQYFGGKRTLAPRIVAELGPHNCYWEPMCGSLAVILAKPPVSMETVSDLHGGVTCLARVVAHDQLAGRLYDRLNRTLACEGIFDDCKAAVGKIWQDWPDCDLDAAYNFFISSWLGMGGMSGTRHINTSFSVRYTNTGGSLSTRLDNAVQSIPAWHERLKGVTILRRSVFDLLPRIADEDSVVIYLDPPYVVKGEKYVHDFKLADHHVLAGMAHRFRKSRVVISYYEDPLVRGLYAGWTFVACTMAKALGNQGMRGKPGSKTESPEVLIINGPSLTTGPSLFPEDAWPA